MHTPQRELPMLRRALKVWSSGLASGIYRSVKPEHAIFRLVAGKESAFEGAPARIPAVLITAWKKSQD